MGIAIPQVVTASRATGAQVIDGSLKFDDGKTQHLTRTPSSDGNKRTWTWSGWVKPAAGVLGNSSGASLFAAYSDSNYRDVLRFGGTSTDAIDFQHRRNGTNYGGYTDAKLRDYGGSGWYHVVLAWNDGATIYVNGVEQSLSAAAGGLTDTDNGQINNDRIHYIGARSSSGSAELGWDGQMSQVYFVDGQELDASYFGFTDPLTNTWKPKKFIPQATPNSGVTWSSGAGSNFESARPASNGFNGDPETFTRTDNASVTATVTLPSSVPFTTLQVRGARDSGNGTITINGTDVSSQFTSSSSTLETVTITGVTSPLTSIALTGISGSAQPRFSQIIVDGVTLIDGDTANIGRNGFYLPMDGNSPIGKDQSGNGNDWTPVNFGGSVELDNPQVSGARPILNTLPGGAQAGVDVFGSKQNVGYAVTVYNSGGGNKYYLDGVEAPTLTGLIRGATYTFDQSDSTNSTHPLVFGTTAEGNNFNGATATSASAGSAGAATTITIPYDGPNTIYYHCSAHSGMGADITGITTNEKLADQYASNCTLAIPFAGNKEDVSASIACTSTTGDVSNTNAVSSNDSSNFYSGSWYFDASGDYLTVPYSADSFNFGTGDFTVEAYVNQLARANYTAIISSTNTSINVTNHWTLGYSNTADMLSFKLGSGGSSAVTANFSAHYGKWSHVAATRESGTIRLFFDGQEVASATDTSSLTGDTGSAVKIGQRYTNQNAYSFNGYMSDLRVYKGVAKYTSNFVPAAVSPDILPDTPSGVSGGSKLTKITDGAINIPDNNSRLSLADSDDAFNLGSGDWTIEAFVYLTNVGGDNNVLFFQGYTSDYLTSQNRMIVSYITTGGIINIAQSTTGTDNYDEGYGNTALSDNRWYHLAYVRNGSNLDVYVDGKKGTTRTARNLNNSSAVFCIGSSTDNVDGFNGFISNFRLVKGTAVYTANFTPPSAPLTNITNTKLLCCQSNTSAIEGAVKPGAITANGDAAATNFNPFITDINTVRGQETGYATLNPLINGVANALSDGNLTSLESTGNHGRARSTLTMDTSGKGKFYFEAKLIVVGGSYPHIGVIDSVINNDSNYVGSGTNCFSYMTSGNKQLEGASSSSYGDSFTTGDTIGCSLDCGSGELRFYKNGVDQGVAKTITTNYHACFAVSSYSNGKWEVNFGQKPFKFPPPDGFQPLNTANTRPVNVIARPDQYVGVTTGNFDQQKTHVTGFQPDLIWHKARTAGSHFLTDSVRGVNSYLVSNSTNAAGTFPVGGQYGITSFNSNGWTQASYGPMSESSMVAWTWKAGGNKNTLNVDDVGYASAAAAGLTGGDITPTGASVGTKQGFSIIKYDGSGTAGDDFPHGLSQAPEFVIVKDTEDSDNWQIYHEGAQTSGALLLKFTTDEATSNTGPWNNTAPTSTLITLGGGGTNDSGNSHICYAWHSVPGLQKFGSYIGNSTTDGPFIELGFRPALVMLKAYVAPSTSVTGWVIQDSERGSFNVINSKQLYANENFAEGKRGDGGSTNPQRLDIDFLSNGFKLRDIGNESNATSYSYIYAAWAEAPSVDLYGGGANAR